MSRNTVRKVICSGEASFTYERSVQPLPKLGRWAAELDQLLEANGSTQFDWSHEVVLIGGVTTTVKVAHLRLCHSRMF